MRDAALSSTSRNKGDMQHWVARPRMQASSHAFPHPGRKKKRPGVGFQRAKGPTPLDRRPTPHATPRHTTPTPTRPHRTTSVRRARGKAPTGGSVEMGRCIRAIFHDGTTSRQRNWPIRKVQSSPALVLLAAVHISSAHASVNEIMNATVAAGIYLKRSPPEPSSWNLKANGGQQGRPLIACACAFAFV